MKNIVSLVLVLIAFSTSTNAQNALKKRLWNGVQTIAINDSLVKALGIKKKQGVLVVRTVPNATAANAKMLVNDVLVKINETFVLTPDDLFNKASITNLRAGDAIKYEVIRAGKTELLSTIVVGRANELNEKLDYVYSSVAFQEGSLNAITSFPKNKVGQKVPGILFIQGYTCAQNIDLTALHPYKRYVISYQNKDLL
jgi:PDZ domain